ncbi:MAG: DUF3817 domain-containing protein [Gammaproteobacteria bacterium]|nr:DUF3817 domain-containing protein [Gammaproteobacteria bacterium]
MLDRFRSLSLIEGSSLLILLFIAMPLKYYLDVKLVVPIIGTIHGLLFLSYMVMSLIVSHQRHWSILKWLMVFFAGVFPFACFLLDRMLKRESATAA